MIEWILMIFLLGLSIASIWAHPRMLNLNLIESLSIGLGGAIVSNLIMISLIYWGFSESLSIFIGFVVLLISGSAIMIWKFFRDPERSISKDSNAILSPADGKIIYLREIKKGEIPCPIKGKSHILIDELTKTSFLKKEDGYLMGINMSLLDVHVNRAPISGKIEFIKHTKGGLNSLKLWESDIKNERNTTIIRNDSISIVVIQIASKMVAKIITHIKEGDLVNKGDRIGRITMGSQVDVVLPYSVEILVREGELVKAGETIIGRIASDNI
jgi:phosphatidylserine decarboxylase